MNLSSIFNVCPVKNKLVPASKFVSSIISTVPAPATKTLFPLCVRVEDEIATSEAVTNIEPVNVCVSPKESPNAVEELQKTLRQNQKH